MRRFIESIQGRMISTIVAVALMVPFMTLGLVARADAQSFGGPIDALPTWAIVNFKVDVQGGEAYGRAAAEALVNEITKSGKVEPLSLDSVDRKIQQLGLIQPVTGSRDILRLGTELQLSERVTSVVSGEILNYRVVSTAAGKRADVAMRVFVWDVASGQIVNGAALSASSGTRSGDVTDQSLVEEAIATAAFNAYREIQGNTLPTATVLNTLDNSALINQGSRTGFQSGQEIIVVRGREQVAAGVVSQVEPDKAFVKITRSFKGIQPGDKVRAVFQVPSISPKFTSNGGVKVNQPKRGGNNNGLIATVLVLGALVLLGAGGNDNKVVGGVKAEATTVPALPVDAPAVKVSWRVDGFVKGNNDRVRFQVWRDDVFNAPVIVVPGSVGSALDRGDINATFSYSDLASLGFAGGGECVGDLPGTDGAGFALAPGRAYRYSVELIYRVNAIDVPGSSAGTTGGGGTTGTTTGGGLNGGTTGGGLNGGGTTGGTLGGTLSGRGSIEAEYDALFATRQGTTTNGGGNNGGTTAGGGFCYFRTERVAASGTATPLPRPTLRAPVDNAPVTIAPVFRFDSVRGSATSIALEYALQFSTSPDFPAGNQTRLILRQTDTNSTGTLSTRAVPEALTFFPGVQTIYFRVGVRNISDKPGPVLEGGERYVFSAFSRFTRPTLPPNP